MTQFSHLCTRKGTACYAPTPGTCWAGARPLPAFRARHVVPLLLALVLAASAVAAAQEAAPPPLKLSLQQAVDLTLRQSPLLKASQEEVAMASARLDAAKSERRPIVSSTLFLTGGSMGAIYGTPAAVMPSVLINAPRSRFTDLDFMLMYPVYTGGRLRGQIGRAAGEQKASAAELEAMRLELVLMTKTRYRKVEFAQANVEVFAKSVADAEERLRVDEAAFGVGKIPEFYVLRDRAELANAQQMLTNAKRDLEVALVDLRSVMGVDQQSPLELTETLTEPPSVELKLPDLLTQAARKRPELRRAREQIAAANAGVAVARSAYRPQVGLALMSDTMKAKGMPSFSGVAGGVVAALPILDGGRRRADLREAQARLRQAQASEAAVKLEVERQVATSWQNLLAARQNVQTSQAALASAEEDYRVAQLRYTSGKSVNVEALDALVALVRARTNHTQALYEVNVAADELSRSLGER